MDSRAEYPQLTTPLEILLIENLKYYYMAKPIDQSWFKRDDADAIHMDDTPTVEYHPGDPTSPEVQHNTERTKEAHEAYSLMKREASKKPIAQMRFKTVQQTAADYIIARANLNIEARKGDRGETKPYTELARFWQERGKRHEALINALKDILAVFTEYKLDTSWTNVVGLHDREKIAEWAFRVGEDIATDLAQDKKGPQKGGLS